MVGFSDKCKGQIIPVFFHPEYTVCEQVLKACYEGGVRMFEFTNRGENAYDIFVRLRRVADSLSGLSLGVGSVVYAPDAERFIAAGAEFVVGPCLSVPVLDVCRVHNIPYVPGCGTITEIFNAQQMGCEVTKLFPGDVYGSEMIRGLMAPMPWSKVMVTGGVSPDNANLQTWFNAGAWCVGMGSKLFPKSVLDTKDWPFITNTLKRIINK